MANSHDYLALDWVREEIQETLDQAQQALEAYVENPDDSTRMRFCQTYLHQVYGTLQMVEFYGAGLLAEEMEKLAEALLDGRVSQVADAQETLMRAVLQLPPYLDRVQSSRRDLPVVLLPLLNDLRAARGEPLMTETALFKPDLEAQRTTGDVPASVAGDEQFPALARKIRQMYQVALLGVIRGDNLAQNLDYMSRAFAKLEQITGGARRAPLWSIGAALVEGIRGEAIERGTSVKMVLGQIDRALRALTLEGVDNLRQSPPRDLLKNLLYYIAKCEADSPRISQVRETYNLAEALPSEAMIDEERQRMSGPDQAAMGSVVEALSEELTSVKEALEQFVHSDARDASELQGQRQTLKQVADTLAMLGLGSPRQRIQDQLDVMDAMIDGEREFSSDQLMDVAGALLYVESTLSSMGQDTPEGEEAQPEHVVEANSAVVRECRAGLEEAKEGIVEYIASQWDRQHLEPVPDKLNTVRGGLEVTQLQRPALILRQCIRYIEENLLIDEPVEPDWQTMDTLADAITGVEYYLERLAEDPQTPDDILDIARRSVNTLGYGLDHEEFGRSEAEAETGDPEAPAAPGGREFEALAEGPESAEADLQAAPEEPVSEPHTAVTDTPAPFDAGEDPGVEEADEAAPGVDEPVPGEAEELSAEPEYSAAEPEPEPKPAPEPGAETEPDVEAQAEPDEPAAARGGAVVPPTIPEHWVQVDPPPLDAFEEDEGLIDDEIIEIFVEEAGEVLEALNEYFPRWAENHSDEEALVEFRRAFHTLKGSGRMVGAHTTGELAWSVENMMNRVIDETIEPTPELVALVRTVHGLVPEMVEAFSHKAPAPYDVQPLMSAAFTLAHGHSIEGVPDVRGEAATEGASLEAAPEEQPGEEPAGEESAPSAQAGEIEAEPDTAQTDMDVEEISYGPPPGAESATDEEPEEIELSLPEDHARESGGDSEDAASAELSDPDSGATAEPEEIEMAAPAPDPGDAGEIEEIDYGAPTEAQEPGTDGQEASEEGKLSTPDAGEPRAVETEAMDADASAGEPDSESDDGDESGNRAVLLEIFGNEAETNLAVVRQWLDGLDRDLSHHPVDDDVHRALHTLKGSARMAEIEAVARVAEPIEKFVKELINTSQPADPGVVVLLEDTVRIMEEAAREPPQSPDAELPGASDLLARIHAARERIVAEAGGQEAEEQWTIGGFLSEGMDLVMDSEQRLAAWKAQPGPDETLQTLRDEVRALSISARRAGLEEVEQLCDALFDCYQAVLDERVEAGPDLVDAAERAHEALVTMMDFLAAGQSLRSENELVAELRGMLDGGGPGGPGPAEPEASQPPGGADLAAPDDASPDEASAPGPEAEAPAESGPGETSPSPAEAESVGPEDLDPEMVEIFLEEADEVLESASEALEQWQQNRDPAPVQGLQRDLHTLKGGARMAGLTPIGNLSHELENIYEGFDQGHFETGEALFDLLHACQDRLAEMVDGVRSGEGCRAAPELEQAIRQFMQHPDQPPEPGGDGAGVTTEPAEAQPETEPGAAPAELTEPASDAEPAEPEPAPRPAAPEPGAAAEGTAPPAPPERDPELVNIFLEEADEILESISNELESWIEAPDNLDEVQSLQRDLHTIKGGARMAEVPELGNLAHELENLYEGLAQKQLSAQSTLFDLLHRCHDRLAEMVDAVRHDEGIHPPDHLIQAIHDYMLDPAAFTLPAAQPAGAGPAPGAADEEAEQPSADVDSDILSLFMEESGQLSEVIEQQINAWREEPDNPAHRDELARALHTLKGGARLAGLDKLGEISHEFENLLNEQQQHLESPSEAFFNQLDQYQEQIARRMATLREVANAGADSGAGAAEASQQPAAGTPSQPATQQPTPAAQQDEANTQTDTRGKRQSQAQPQEMVRLPADMLESLVNLAGETSINRGRVEQGISEFGLQVEEMGSTVQRLYDQLRRLDAETEAQIKANHKQEVEAGEREEGFDPLEMDEYSELNQITKQLSESASDLLDLKQTLLDKTRDTETLLLQQARINTELQEKLMQTRMVPFSRLVPRLRRIVRQASGEVGKRVSFEVINPEGELDRTLLERAVAPLEHMLRNAVDHGVETPEERRQAGKDETGQVWLELSREAGEVMLVLRDDGKGIDTNMVRDKAIERGLMDPNAQLTDQEIQQFIFDAGFSTANQVTQLSGRGVGMDVVASEIKQMGGSVSIDSVKGEGTRFVVRLPFTLAMNRALMVSVGENAYALPLNQIEGVVRISPYELEEYLGEDGAPYHYAGQSYDLEYLGTYVHGSSGHRFDNQTLPLPLLLIRSAEHSVALLVDSLIGSREVVVKSVGPQLSTVAGINGATILGDGSVVIILDIYSLIRASQLQRQHEAVEEQASFGLTEEVTEVPAETEAEAGDTGEGEVPEEAEAAATPVIMVVDDSVTVRKVTGRTLERTGYEVVTAKDGMDAVSRLEEYQPSLVVLDIEMPRMDGFEVASHMRHSDRLAQVPIIMVTSRTGEKHRERAFDIGVNAYMGKPFQESELLNTISELIGTTREAEDS